jgi:hypothetical protein
MGLYKRAHVRGMAFELSRQGYVSWPSKEAEEQVADEVADQFPDQTVPEVTGEQGLSPEDAAQVVNKLVEVANAISEQTGGAPDPGVNKMAAATSYEDAAAAAALSVMQKAAAEGPDVPGEGKSTPADGATAETKIDATKTPSSERVGPKGTSDLSTAGGAVGKEEKRPDQPGSEENPPSGEVAKAASSIMDMLRKMSADGASLSGGAVKGTAPTPRKDLDDNLVIPGAVASSKGHTGQSVPASAVVGHTSPQPAGTPGRSAPTPNEVSKSAALEAAKLILAKYSEECKEEEKKEEKKEDKAEEKKEHVNPFTLEKKDEKDSEKEKVAAALALISNAILNK